jgi:hypothetical protein
MKQLFASLLVILSVFVGIPARADFHLYHATWNDPASTQPAVSVDQLPRGVAPCLWTATRTDVWANPVTADQVKHVAAIARAGGTFNWRMDNEGLVDVAPGAFVMLDGESTQRPEDEFGSRSDAEIRRMIDLYRYWYARAAGPKSSANFCVYAFRFDMGGATWQEGRDRVPRVILSMEQRKAEFGDVVQKLPVLLVEMYVYDPFDEWLEARSAGIENLRRLYPGKPVYGLVRGDVPFGTNAGPYPAAFLGKYVRRCRSALDGVIVWGDRAGNMELMRRLAEAR